MGCYVTYIGKYSPTFRTTVWILYLRPKLSKNKAILGCFNLNTKSIQSFETSVNIYNLIMQHNNPEDFGLPILNAFRDDQQLYWFAWRSFEVLLRCSLSFRCVRIVAKTAYYLCHVRPSIRPPECINEARIRRISMKFHMADFYENLSR
jgi:hypothetical protein